MATDTARRADVPVYQLYGEEQQWLTPDLVHCESIAARSRLHNWEIEPHRHYGLFQLLWLEQGAASLQLDGQPGQLAAGCVLLVPQHCVHGFRFSTDAQGQVITIAYPFFERLEGGLGQTLAAFPAPLICDLAERSGQPLIEAMLSAIDQEYRGNAPHRRSALESLLTTLLVWLTRHSQKTAAALPDEPHRARRHLAVFTDAIELDFARHHRLAHYARKVGISAAHLNALCRQLAHRSALELIHARMLLEARRNLVYTSMTIQSVGEALGFTDPAYFTRFFKRQTGLSPKAFRLRARALVEEE